MTDLIVEVVGVETLTPDPQNARKHGEKNLAAIAGSLSRFGQRRPLVVWQQVVIAGNGTLEAAKSLGWEKVAITRVPSDWTHEQARAFALADNRTAELAEWDADILADQLIELDAVGWDLSEVGFAPLSPTGASDFLDDLRGDGGGGSDEPFVAPDTYPLPYGFTPEQRSEIVNAINVAKAREGLSDAPTALAHIARLYSEGAAK